MNSEIKEGILVLHLEGNLLGEHTNLPVLETVQQNINGGNKKVVLDLGKVNFVNSTGLGMLLSAVTKTRNAGGELVLCSLPDQMKKLLQMTKLENVFRSYPDEASAIAFLKAA